MESGRKLTIGVRYEVNVKKWGRGSCFCSPRFPCRLTTFTDLL